MAEFIIKNARVVTATEVLHGSVQVVGDRIGAVDSGNTGVAAGLDLNGDLLIPGLIELHTDNFERHLEPRPNVRWPEMPALLGHDAEVIAAGITTVFDALGVGDSDLTGVRGQDMGKALAAIDQAYAEDLLRAEHRLHVRCEVPAPNTVELFEPFMEHPRVGLISLMDHTPGQRQWTDIEHARVYYTGKKGWSEAKFERTVSEAATLQERHAKPNRRYFIQYARERHIPLASHDDTLPEHVAEAHVAGMAISEFPTSATAAREAHRLGLAVIMGAPNLVRGGSHSGNVATMDIARARLLDALSSDYVPASLLLAASMLTEDAGFRLPEAIATVSRNPARSAGLEDRGEIAPGLRADLVQVRIAAGRPIVRGVWRGGVRVN
jgi:alpha-D-ribose 1-methylphosphonate 5-triphosphate diphosphatase